MIYKYTLIFYNLTRITSWISQALSISQKLFQEVVSWAR